VLEGSSGLGYVRLGKWWNATVGCVKSKTAQVV
jgi:hypothetical protein